ncbi:MAG: IS1634 family transposase, partial [Gammaproteobacteria bacterium]
MFVKVTSSGTRRYVQLVESYRNENGRPRQKTVATLGRLEDIGEGRFDALIDGLLRITGRGGDPQEPDPEVVFERARSLGDVWVLSELWKQLGFDRLSRVFRSRRIGFDVEAMIRTMVFNRLCDPESKLGVLRWLESVAIPGIDPRSVTHQNLLRAMDAWNDHRPEVDAVLAGLL